MLSRRKKYIRKYAQKNEGEFFSDVYGLIYVNFPYFFYDIKDFPLSYRYFVETELILN